MPPDDSPKIKKYYQERSSLFDEEEKRVKPVIVVPGIAGSVLTIQNEQDRFTDLWDPSAGGIITGLAAGLIDKLGKDKDGKDLEGGISPTGLWSGYRPLIRFLEFIGYDLYAKKGGLHTLFPCPYDWRNDNRLSAGNELANVITAAKKATGSPKVDIIAHSMGGLVARYYCMNIEPDSVDNLILLGTPNFGSPRAYFFLKLGWISSFEIFGITIKNITTAKLQSLALNWRSVYQLLPDQFYIDQQIAGADSWVVDDQRTDGSNPQAAGKLLQWSTSYKSNQDTRLEPLNVTQAHIDDAIQFKTEIGDTAPPGTNTYCFFSRAHETAYGAILKNDDKYSIVKKPLGDSTVPLASAKDLKGATPKEAVLEHGDLPKDPIVFTELRKILKPKQGG